MIMLSTSVVTVRVWLRPERDELDEPRRACLDEFHNDFLHREQIHHDHPGLGSRGPDVLHEAVAAVIPQRCVPENDVERGRRASRPPLALRPRSTSFSGTHLWGITAATASCRTSGPRLPRPG